MKTPLLLLLLTTAIAHSWAQTTLKADVGIGYLEHTSFGTTITLREKSSFTLTYGSNFFYKPRHFSTLFVHYERSIPSISFQRVIPGAGVKLGQTLFTDDYYKWKVVSAVPFLSASRNVSDLLQISVQGGMALSRIQSVTRISYGEIGKYRRYLPEANVLLQYRILKFNHD